MFFLEKLFLDLSMLKLNGNDINNLRMFPKRHKKLTRIIMVPDMTIPATRWTDIPEETADLFKGISEIYHDSVAKIMYVTI